MKEDVLIKSEEQTDPQYGTCPQKRPILSHIKKGIINLDKPSGPTSHQVAAWARDIIGVSKAGHSGTLDPKVTGVLPIATGDATRLISMLLLSGKEYVALMNLHGETTGKEIKTTLSQFQGKIYQKPPLKSAVKRQLRTKSIYALMILERNPRNVLFQVNCEAGTYIRKLCCDIGLVLGTGAHMQNLRRVRVGPFTEEGLVTLHDLKDAYMFYKEDGEEKYLRKCIHPMESAVSHLKKIWLKDSAVSAICHGANPNIPGISKLNRGIEKNETIALMTLKDEIIAVANADKTTEQIEHAQKGQAATLSRVVMEPDTYPKKWKKHRDI